VTALLVLSIGLVTVLLKLSRHPYRDVTKGRGCCQRKQNLTPSHVWSEGGGCHQRKWNPLHLTFGVREGATREGVVAREREPPPSHV